MGAAHRTQDVNTIRESIFGRADPLNRVMDKAGFVRPGSVKVIPLELSGLRCDALRCAGCMAGLPTSTTSPHSQLHRGEFARLRFQPLLFLLSSLRHRSKAQGLQLNGN